MDFICLSRVQLCMWEQGLRSGESARLPPLWPGFDSRTWRHMWVEFVVGCRPCSEGFSSSSPVFLPPQKLTFQIPIDLFSLYILLPHFRPRDGTLGNDCFQILKYLRVYE